MQNILRRGLICLAFLLALPLATCAWEEEILKGSYTYHSRDLSISFDWTQDWVKHLVINGHPFPKIKNDIIGKFGSTAFIQIFTEETHGSQKIIELLFFCNAEKPLLISGFYAETNDYQDDGTFHVVTKKAIEMTHKPPPKDSARSRPTPEHRRKAQSSCLSGKGGAALP